MAVEAPAGERASVRIRFDPDQEYQLEAVQSVVGLFEGQELAAGQSELRAGGSLAQGSLVSNHGTGNAMSVADRQIAANMATIQDAGEIPPESRGEPGPDGDLASRDFTIEMETGTGKTYVYLRTIFELNRVYGWTKFVIVVPSVAIREGVEANLRLLADHLAELYDGVNYDTWVYDSKAPARLRAFAQANYLQILIINIDAFNKADVNTIFRAQDEMMGYAPVELLRATAPIVVLDEPQNMESEAARAAIASLNALFKLRYSATHLDTYHQVYRLTPADAYNLGLVKQIEVWSVLQDENANRPYVKLLAVKAGKRSISARLELDVAASGAVRRRRVTVGADSPGDLAELTGRSVYDGYVVSEIRTGEIEFENGIVLSEGKEIGPDRDALQRVQIRTAVVQHLDKELDLLHRLERGEVASLKVLSLFFIDRVDNYWPEDGKFRRWFEEEYERAAALPKYDELSLPPVSEVHGGYFARDRSGGAKDTRGTTKADGDAYELIMRDKQRLLSVDEPLRFIFSHSALREGWDNPNVFVITTLNESRSELKKRQEIGRGLRLPVMSDGRRCGERAVATLGVIANESYEEFAAQLQSEIEAESGEPFGREKIKNGRSRKVVQIQEGYGVDPAFVSLWEHIKHRTRYSVSFDSDALVEAATKRLVEAPSLDSSYVRASHAAIAIDAEQGVEAELIGQKAPVRLSESFPIPDLISHIAASLPVSREAVARTLVQSKRLGEATINPQQFVDLAQAAIRASLAELMLDGIKYTRRASESDSVYEMSLFEERELTGYSDNLVEVDKSIYSDAVCDSDLERRIALALDKREDIQLFVKLPGWFVVDTPVGGYNPDWAIVKNGEDGTEHLYLVRESKPTRDSSRLRPEERLKTGFGGKHFESLGVSFELIDDPAQV